MNYASPEFLSQSRTAFPINRPPTLADFRALIEPDPGITATQRRDLLSALNHLPRWFGRPLPDIAATPAHLRELFGQISPARLGVSDKTWANIRSLLCHAIARYSSARIPVTRAIPLTGEWQSLLNQVKVPHHRHSLGRLAAFCSALGIAASQVSAKTLLGLHEALLAEEIVKKPRSIIKNTIGAWNRCRRTVAGWPDVVLQSPFKKQYATLPLSSFPASFVEDTLRWRDKVTDDTSLEVDTPDRPLASATVDQRIFQIRQFASALIHTETLPLQDLSNLAVMFTPQRFKSALRWFLQRPHSDESWRLYYLANAMLRIAKHHCKFDNATLTALAAIAKKLKPHSPRQMAARNRQRLRQFDDPRNVAKLLQFPKDQLSRALKEKNRLRATKRIERALVVTLMIYGGLRQATLRQMEIVGDFSWTQPGCQGICHLHVAAKKVKNRRSVERELPNDAADLLRLYLTEYRPYDPGAHGPYLFPGVSGGTRSRSQFREGISQAFSKDTGLELNPHLIRHAIAKIAVERDPGSYLAVSRVLGHATLSTTLGHYLGTETKAAGRHIDRLLAEAKEERKGSLARRQVGRGPAAGQRKKDRDGSTRRG